MNSFVCFLKNFNGICNLDAFFSANVCANIHCAKEAQCRETELGPVCECFSGYVDISRQHGMAAGHVCRKLVKFSRKILFQ